MTIAACYLSPEGVVFGADSTTTFNNASGPHYFNNAQKVMELGNGASLGIVTWGLGNFENTSYRLLYSYLADMIVQKKYVRVSDIAKDWINIFWLEYNSAPMIVAARAAIANLQAKQAHNPFNPVQLPSVRTQQEEELLDNLINTFTAGFCIGGNTSLNRLPIAYSVVFQPQIPNRPTITQLPMGFSFWGAPNIVQRLVYGYDSGLISSVLASGRWNGTAQDLRNLFSPYQLQHSTNVPIRDAIDFIYACVFSTIKALKFSTLSQICGGPIEIAVITADRPFRWVRHKNFDSAVQDGAP